MATNEAKSIRRVAVIRTYAAGRANPLFSSLYNVLYYITSDRFQSVFILIRCHIISLVKAKPRIEQVDESTTLRKHRDFWQIYARPEERVFTTANINLNIVKNLLKTNVSFVVIVSKKSKSFWNVVQ